MSLSTFSQAILAKRHLAIEDPTIGDLATSVLDTRDPAKLNLAKLNLAKLNLAKLNLAKSVLSRLTLTSLSMVSVLASSLSLTTGVSAVSAEVILEQRGNLAVGDAVLEDGSLYDRYTFAGRSGQQVTITLESEDFDPYLILLNPEGQRIYENDDISRSDRNARLIVDLPAAGTYTVVANSYMPRATGEYAIKIDRGPEPASKAEAVAAEAASDGTPRCNTALLDTVESLKTNREVEVLFSAVSLANLYEDVPTSRPNGLAVTLNGTAATSIMFSPRLLNHTAASLVRDCTTVGAVIFTAPEDGFERTFGYLPGRPRALQPTAVPVSEFTCAIAPGEVQLPEWGYRACL
ncbi:MAG: hypothetical protein HC800_20055 [Phormidesmis sp. RL_2_1]|nr:hypothetical protein [Phormidesmis sp. RL_2_1]